MSFSPHRLYGKIEGQKITERSNSSTKDIYFLGSKSFELNPNNIPSYSAKIYDQYIVTSSISISSMNDACYCPFNYNIYFVDSSNTYAYSTVTDTLVKTISVSSTIGGISYAPSSNILCVPYGNAGNGDAAIISASSNSIVYTNIYIERGPLSCDFISAANSFFIGSGSYAYVEWGDSLDAINWGYNNGLSPLKAKTQFVYCPTKNTIYAARLVDSGINELSSSGASQLNYISWTGGDDAYRLAYCPSTDELYITITNGKIFILDVHSNIIVKTLNGVGGSSIPAYYPTVDRMIVTNGTNCYAVNPQNKTVTQTITGVGTPSYLIYSPYNDRMYAGGGGILTSFKYW